MLFYNCPYYDNFRFEETDDFDGLKDINELYELETYDLPDYCPYRSLLPKLPSFIRPGDGKAPASPPPTLIPTKPQGTSGPSIKAVDPMALKPCTFKFVYIWPRYGKPFWAYPTYIGRRSVSGYRWNGRRWVYFGYDLRRIESFQCM